MDTMDTEEAILERGDRGELRRIIFIDNPCLMAGGDIEFNPAYLRFHYG